MPSRRNHPTRLTRGVILKCTASAAHVATDDGTRRTPNMETTMGKSQDAKKDTKKTPAKSAKEKKAEKLEKKASKKY